HSAMVRTPSNRVEGGKKLGEIVPQNSQKRTLYQRVRNISGATQYLHEGARPYRIAASVTILGAPDMKITNM
ncbi:hypothetical protein, partial [Tepidimonas taiwanensis]|uniref:hypothetical protein n=1 Tax=Tepidimonas taiwanensis TaxID=307486 RepID=UPI001C8F2FE2